MTTEQRTKDSILDRLQEQATGMERPDALWGQPVAVAIKEDETGQVEPMGFATRRQYVLSATVEARFWANRAERSEARKAAISSLARCLYADVLHELAVIRHAIWDGDPKAALVRLGDLETRLNK